MQPQWCTARLLRFEELAAAILVISYIAINFAADLPRFLIGENLLLALLYTILTLEAHNCNPASQPLLVFLAAFNAGRVSRSIISPRGEPGELAIQHIPLLLMILAVAIPALLLSIRLATRG